MASHADKVAIGLIQMSCAPEPRLNLDKAIAKIEEAARRGAQIVCTQELFGAHYPCQTEDPKFFDLAEPIPGPTTEALGAVAKARKIIIVASIFERRAAGVYHNTAAVIDEAGKIVGRYRKMHIPDDPRYYEKFYFTPGDLDFVAHPTSRGPVGVLVCWDQWFPEAARLTAMAGAQILFYPTAIGWWHGEPKKSAPNSKTPGRRSSAATRSPTASSSRRSIASASRVNSSSGALHSSPIHSARSSRAPAPPPRKRWSSNATSPRSSKSAATGPSCAIAESTPTPT